MQLWYNYVNSIKNNKGAKMYILVFVVIIIAILIKLSLKNKETNQIQAFNNAINKAKEGFISDAQIQEVKKKFEPTFKHLLRKNHKSKPLYE